MDGITLTSADIATSLDSYAGELSEWINDLIEGDGFDTSFETEGSQKRPVDLTELDNRVAQLATKLEVACQDTSSQLERTIEDISRNVPRLNFNLQFMRESALALQRELGSIHRNASSNEADDSTTKALEQLQYLDAVKRGMESARAVLQEAENWNTLEPEITSLLKEASYSKAATRLSEAAKSMSVFQHTPEYESRRTLMINLQNQTEAVLSAALVAAINSKDLGACRGFHEIFDKIEREGEFRNYYFGARRTGVLDLWRNTSLSDVQGDDAATEPADGNRTHSLKFAELLARFFAELLVLINDERASIPSIFASTAESTTILSLFIQSVFETLTPSLSQRLSGMAAHYGSTALPELINAFKMTEDFALKVEKIVEKMTLIKSGGLAPTSPTREEARSHSRQKSKRMSISRRITPNRGSISMTHPPTSSETLDYTWEQPLFEPFIDFQCEYPSLEKRFLEDGLDSINRSSIQNTNDDDAEVKARMLREKAIDVFGIAEEALGRCLSLTHGYGAVGLMQAVDNLFTQFFTSARSDLLHSPNRDSATTNERYESELLTQDELSNFQLALNLLNTSRAFKERLGAVDARYKSELTLVVQNLRTSNSSAGGYFIDGTARGEAELLAQSTLNSMELLSLFETLDPYPPNTPFTAGLGGSFATQQTTGPSASTHRSEATPSVRTQPILRGSFRALTEFARLTQSYLQQLILSPLLSQLSAYSSLPSWSAADPQTQKKGYDYAIPIFSLSATPTMQKICDGLMALPRMFEDYAGDDEALAFSLETLPFVDRDPSIKEYLDWASQAQIAMAEKEPHRSPRTKRMSISSPSMRRLSVSSSSLPPTAPPSASRPPPLSAEAISSAWLSSITLTLLSHLTSNVLPMIRILSATGAAQLAYDLSALSNIGRALNAEWDDLERWKECCEMSNEDGRKRWLTLQGVSAFAQGLPSIPNVDGDAIIRLVARIRGWTSPETHMS